VDLFTSFPKGGDCDRRIEDAFHGVAITKGDRDCPEILVPLPLLEPPHLVFQRNQHMDDVVLDNIREKARLIN